MQPNSMIYTPLNVFSAAEILQMGLGESVMHNCFFSLPNILVGSQISVFSITQNMGSVSRSLGFHILHAREGSRILVAGKIRVAVCSFEADHLPLFEGAAWGFLLKFISSHPKQKTISGIHLDSLGKLQAGCVSELSLFAS